MKKELLLTWVGIALCLLALVLFYRDVVLDVRAQTVSIGEGLALAALITALAYGSLVYMGARCGYLRRTGRTTRRHLPSQSHSVAKLPSVCVLVPSYREEIGVLRQTLVSAAIAEFPSRRVVALLDDPSNGNALEQAALRQTREMIAALDASFREQAARLRYEYGAFRSRNDTVHDLQREGYRLAESYERAAAWTRALGERCRVRADHLHDHTDEFFVNSIVGASANAHCERAAFLRCTRWSLELLEREYQRLVSLFDVGISSFERKRYANLSHASNKAMNLNSYIGLMGGQFKTVRNADELPSLQACGTQDADFVVPEADYILTLDADSFVLPDYLTKLVGIMESDARLGVAQTPYSAVPGARNWLERAAGAQTDIQYIAHQGFTAFNATFWVGANAVLRLSALRDIQTTVLENGNVVPVFIQDRTVIEDTGSTLDLIRRGWRLHNHPERLAYSATPQDFGSLIIQRRRWSNGGLIIFPDLLRHAGAGQDARPRLSELLFRAHYLCSPALASGSVLLLMLIPFAGALESPWVAATALPYYALYARDLRHTRYRWAELPLVYALSLMLLPVNLAGVLRSLQQIVTGRKSAFGRTPKIEDRTPTPRLHLVFQVALLAAVAVVGLRNALSGHYYLAAFCALNFVLIAAGQLLFIGPRNALADVIVGFRKRSTPLVSMLLTKEGAPAAAPKTDNSHSRVVGMDGLRAYAIVLVFLVHFLAQYFNGHTTAAHIDFDAFRWDRADSVVDLAAYYFWASHYGVDLFFFLSGFLIFRMIRRPTFVYSRFLGNRLLRLYPAFAVAVSVYLLYVGIFWNKHYDGPTVAANFLMLQGIWELGITPIVVPTWSLSFEWLFYLAFPVVLLLPAVRGKVSMWHVAFMGLVVLLIIAPVGPHYIRFVMFLGGAALAAMSPTTVRSRMSGISDLVVIVAYAFGNLLFVDQQNYYRFIPVYLVTSFALVAKVVYGDGFLHRVFCLPVLIVLGRVSYSFYLLHGLVIIIVCDHLAAVLTGLPEGLRFFALLLCAFGSSVAVASLFYRFLERPYFEHKHRSWFVATRSAGSAKR
ncbi:MAG TPA: glycosyltransferase family 2 protein [Casimicrobiaceae bacterium]|nr:glycosyltransferase family 2 protein [Casimicrobiaceae bacterium]